MLNGPPASHHHNLAPHTGVHPTGPNNKNYNDNHERLRNGPLREETSDVEEPEPTSGFASFESTCVMAPPPEILLIEEQYMFTNDLNETSFLVVFFPGVKAYGYQKQTSLSHITHI